VLTASAAHAEEPIDTISANILPKCSSHFLINHSQIFLKVVTIDWATDDAVQNSGPNPCGSGAKVWEEELQISRETDALYILKMSTVK
jgi:hypothetical protein